MNITLRRLHQLVPGLAGTPEEIAARLRDKGINVARVAPLRELLRPVVVGRVESVTQHPNADRLRVCVVDDGTETRLQIVTGASNVEANAYYPLIRSGVTLPNGTKIKRGKLRGEVSEGMLGSPDELELGEGHEGLMTLSGEPAPGTPLPEVVEAEGEVLVIHGEADEESIRAALAD